MRFVRRANLYSDCILLELVVLDAGESIDGIAYVISKKYQSLKTDEIVEKIKELFLLENNCYIAVKVSKNKNEIKRVTEQWESGVRKLLEWCEQEEKRRNLPKWLWQEAEFDVKKGKFKPI